MALHSPETLQSQLSQMSRSLIHFNARSLRKNIDAITNFISSVQHAFTFICISETWLSDADNGMSGFPSYQAEYCHRQTDSHGGAAIFLSQDVAYTRRCDLELNVTHCESMWIEVDRSFLNNEKNLRLGCIYRSPSSSLCDFLRRLSEVLSLLTFENKNVVIVGDVNINLLDTDSTS